MRPLPEPMTDALRELTGWCYLVAGAAVLAAAALIPAQEQLERAERLREKAERQVELRREMLEEAGSRIAALTEPDEALVMSLAQTHLNLGPEGARPIALDVRHRTASGGAGAHGGARAAAGDDESDNEQRSRLARLVTERPARSAAIVLGAVCVLVGLLPASEARASHADA